MTFRAVDVVVVGAGIVGLCTAEALMRRGLTVRVVERLSDVAQATSFANAGQLSFGASGPWATPGLLKKVPAMLWDRDGPLRIRVAQSLAEAVYQMKWLRWFALNTRAAAFERNKRRILRLSAASRADFEELRVRVGVDFAFQQRGTLQLFRNPANLEAALQNDLPALKAAGVAVSVVSTDACIAREPGLAQTRGIAGGFVFHDDATGNCHAFARGLFDHLKTGGVEFEFGADVLRIDTDSRARGVTTTEGRFFPAHAVVVATAAWSRSLLMPLGLRVPVFPVKGYSLSAPILDAQSAPVSTILDDSTKIALTRLGDTLRVGGTAEIGGFNSDANPLRAQVLSRTVAKLFPAATDLRGPVMIWSGLRPMTPDGTPVLGRTAVPGLYTNVGHGTLGWTQAAGSAEHVARVICGEATRLDVDDYELGRYGRTVQRTLWYAPIPD